MNYLDDVRIDRIGNADFVLRIPGFFSTGVDVRLYGGPWKNRPKDMPGVCLQAEATLREAASADVLLPIKDFSVPSQESMQAALADTVALLLKHRVAYVGCFGGFGRTGLFLACLLKLTGSMWPVIATRTLYLKRAVETTQQEQFVWDFETGSMRTGLRWAVTWAWLKDRVGLVHPF